MTRLWSSAPCPTTYAPLGTSFRASWMPGASVARGPCARSSPSCWVLWDLQLPNHPDDGFEEVPRIAHLVAIHPILCVKTSLQLLQRHHLGLVNRKEPHAVSSSKWRPMTISTRLPRTRRYRSRSCGGTKKSSGTMTCPLGWSPRQVFSLQMRDSLCFLGS